MTKYLHLKKKYARDILPNFKRLNITNLPRSFILEESHCFFCDSSLSKAKCVNRNAKVITMQGVFSGFTVYVKYCSSCGIFFRYQEFAHGIHNFNDKYLLGFDFCIF